MSAKLNREVPAEEPRNREFVENFALLYKKGVECVAELQNRTLDCAVQHQKETAELWKQMFEKFPWMPRTNLFDGLAGTLDRYAEVQKAATNLALDQARIYVDIVKERAAAAGKTADTMAKFAQQNFERSMAVQKKVAEAAVAETKLVFDNARERFTVPGGEFVAESIRKSVDAVLDAQKDLLETASSRWVPEPETVAAS